MAVILSYLKKIDAPQLVRSVYIGTGAGIAGSVVVGAVFLILSVEFEGIAEQVFEGTTMLLAAMILTTMIFWMSKNSKEYSEDLKSKVQEVLTSTQSYGLAGLAFVSVIREGIETVLFLGSASFTASGIQTILGGSLGLFAAILIGMGIIKYSVRLNLRTFFNVTGVILIFFAAGLVANGLGEFGEAGIVPPLVNHVWNTNWLVSDGSSLGNILWALFGYNAEPSLVQVVGYVGYWILVISWMFKDHVAVAFRRVSAAVRTS